MLVIGPVADLCGNDRIAGVELTTFVRRFEAIREAIQVIATEAMIASALCASQ